MSTQGHHPGTRIATEPGAAPARSSMRYSPVEPGRTHSALEELARAEADYQRLRHAWLRMSRDEPDNEVGLAMVGADMRRAHARLQALGGAPEPGRFPADPH